MIGLSTGVDVTNLLDRVTARPDRYAEVVICCPFIDDQLLPRIVQLLVSTRRAHCGTKVMTAGTASRRLQEALPSPATQWKRSVATVPRLHAKIYVAIARGLEESEAIVTSANLTRCGISKNVELGVRVASSSEPGRKVLQQVHRFVRRLAA